MAHTADGYVRGEGRRSAGRDGVWHLAAVFAILVAVVGYGALAEQASKSGAHTRENARMLVMENAGGRCATPKVIRLFASKC